MGKRLIIGFVVVTAILITILVVVGQKESLPAAARNYMGCFERRDADCMMRYATDEEIKASGLTAKGLQQMLDTWVTPNLAGREASEVSYEGGMTNEWLGYEQHFRKSGMRLAFLRARFFLVDGQPKARILQPLVDLVLESYRPYDATFADETAYERLKADLPILKALPFDGYFEVGLLGASYPMPTRSPSYPSRYSSGSGMDMAVRVGAHYTWDTLLRNSWTEFQVAKKRWESPQYLVVNGKSVKVSGGKVWGVKTPAQPPKAP